MIPILIIIAVAVCVSGGAAAAYFWDDIIRLLKGKKIAVMGERTVGKTSLIQFFQQEAVLPC